MEFNEVKTAIEKGQSVARRSWNGSKWIHSGIECWDGNFTLTPHIFYSTGEVRPYMSTPTDEEADDWVVLLPTEIKRGESKYIDFGTVLSRMREDPSRRFSRNGFDGDDEWIYLTPGHKVPAKDWTSEAGTTGYEDRYGHVEIQPHIDMYCYGERRIGWTPTQEDMLADDWYEVR